MKVYRSDGVLAASYSYDSWGNIVNISGSVTFDGKGVANLNPFRYRSYYYDSETWFYYLQSRYYDPLIGRFINADVLASTGQGILGYNMFAYCGNNPVRNSDTGGTRYCAATTVKDESTDDRETSCMRQRLATLSGQIGGALHPDNYKKDGRQNCYGYILGIVGRVAPGFMSDLAHSWSSTEDVVSAVIADCVKMGRSFRLLNGPYDSVSMSEYKVAVCISTQKSESVYYGFPFHEYHFMVLASDGMWHSRQGPNGAIEVLPFGVTPNMIEWKYTDPDIEYDGTIIYFAIGVG